LKFGASSELRYACKKFLRFAFLLDFIALESLSNIYLHSIHDCIEKIKTQVNLKIDYDLESSKAELPDQNLDAQKKSAAEQSPSKKANAGKPESS